MTMNLVDTNYDYSYSYPIDSYHKPKLRHSMSSKKVHLTPTELDILKALWSMKEGSIKDIITHFAPHKKYAYTSVQTLLKHMQEKEAVAFKKVYNVNVFYPTLAQDQVKSHLIKDLLSRLFKDNPKELVSTLVENEFLDKEDLLELHQTFLSAESTDGEKS